MSRGPLTVLLSSLALLNACERADPPRVPSIRAPSLVGRQWQAPTLLTPEGPEERVVFSNELGVFSLRPDGSHLAQLDAAGLDPLLSPRGGRVLYRKHVGFGDGFDAELWSTSTSGAGEPVQVAGSLEATERDVGYFAEAPAWARDNGWVSYTRVHFKFVGGKPRVCTAALCPGVEPRVVMLQRLESGSGAPLDEAIALGSGTLGTFSEDGRAVTWVVGHTLYVQPLDPDTGELPGPAASVPFDRMLTQVEAVPGPFALASLAR